MSQYYCSSICKERPRKYVLYKQGTDILLRALRYLKLEADAVQSHFDISKLTALPKLKIL